MGIAAEIEQAERDIRSHVRQTPLEFAPTLSEETGAEVWFKLECHQRTGSFKLRGAVHKLLRLGDAAAGGVVTASTGNHGLAVADAGARLGAPVRVFVPETASASKVGAIRRLGAEIVTVAGDPVAAEVAGRRAAEAAGLAYVPPYNDPDVIAGQGTISVELQQQTPAPDAVFLSLGGGGLAAGVGAHLRAWTAAELVACSPERSPVMHRCLEAGRILEMEVEPTLSDGTAGGVESGAITLERCAELIDHSLLVGEDSIGVAMRRVIAEHRVLIEGAAGVAVAGFLADAARWAGRRVVIVLCGANVDPDTLKRVL